MDHEQRIIVLLHIRKATSILQKILNKSEYLEMADQQAAAAVLGYDFFSSHKFTYCYIW